MKEIFPSSISNWRSVLEINCFWTIKRFSGLCRPFFPGRLRSQWCHWSSPCRCSGSGITCHCTVWPHLCFVNLESGAKSRTSVWLAGRLLISVKMFKSNSGAEGVFMMEGKVHWKGLWRLQHCGRRHGRRGGGDTRRTVWSETSSWSVSTSALARPLSIESLIDSSWGSSRTVWSYESIRALMPSVGVDLGEADLVLIELIDLVALQLGNLVLNWPSTSEPSDSSVEFSCFQKMMYPSEWVFTSENRRTFPFVCIFS